MTSRPDFSKETLDDKPCLIGPDAWVISTNHTAGGLENLRVNNRIFAFKLKLKEDLCGVKQGEFCLFIYGLGNDRQVQGVKQLEEETGVKAVAMMNNGGNHHVFLKFWYEAFPDMKIWITPTRAHHTLNQQELREKYADRWELADNTTTENHVHQLLHYFGSGEEMQVDCVLFNQLFVHKDDCGAGWRKVDEGTKMLSNWAIVSIMPKLASQDSSTDEPVFFYKPLKLLLTGHHYEFAYTPKRKVDSQGLGIFGGFMWKRMVAKMIYKPGRYTSGLPEGVARLRDPEVHSHQWQEVMKWDFEYATGHHDPPGVCGPTDNEAIMEGEGGVKGHIKRQLEATGELNNTAVKGTFCPWRKSNGLHKVISHERAMVKKYGAPETLHFGGPNYGPDGLPLEKEAK